MEAKIDERLDKLETHVVGAHKRIIDFSQWASCIMDKMDAMEKRILEEIRNGKGEVPR